MERNRKWRERKEGREILEDEEKELDEKEKRKLKNREWRLKRERVDSDEVGEMLETVSRPMLMAGVLAELSCAGCHREMLELEIWQCEEGHSLCPSCRDLQDQDLALCPLCSQPILGLNYALMAVAQILSGGKCEESEVRIYEDQVHGFALRGDWSSEKDRKAMDEATQQGINWFKKHLA